jgi:hypothetical protein
MQDADRLRELAAKIATEDNHDRFTAPVKELNQLLDEKPQPETSKPTPTL